MKCICKIFGHDFDKKWEEIFHAAMTDVYHSDVCKRCGINIRDVYEVSTSGSVDTTTKKKRNKK